MAAQTFVARAGARR